MSKTKQQKNADLAELESKFKLAKSVVFTSYKGTSVKNMDKLRNVLRQENIFSKVYKITLVKKALQAIGIDSSGIDYKTPVILSISEQDETAPAKAIKNLSKEIQSLSILEGVLEGKVVSKQQVEALAALPNKQALRGMLVGTINAPVSGFVNVLAGNIRGLVNVLNAIAAQ